MGKLIQSIKDFFQSVSPAKIGQYIQETQLYRSVFRVGVPDTDRKRMLVMDRSNSDDDSRKPEGR